MSKERSSHHSHRSMNDRSSPRTAVHGLEPASLDFLINNGYRLPVMADEGQRTTSMSARPNRGIPEGLWMSCPRCKATLYRKEVQAKFGVCNECDHHFTVSAGERIKQLLD
ncbi:MAG TPA: hypothetical protein VKD71_06955, partial [Gemmataceae bacterium]|nr:hypothetical protein [Gemmataceae bacterium]